MDTQLLMHGIYAEDCFRIYNKKPAINQLYPSVTLVFIAHVQGLLEILGKET